MKWQVTFKKNDNSDVEVVYAGQVNLFEFIGLLEIEKDKLKQILKDRIKDD